MCAAEARELDTVDPCQHYEHCDVRNAWHHARFSSIHHLPRNGDIRIRTMGKESKYEIST